MEQRALRLGDTVDDYCPRERRITNHVVVAIVVDAIRQTRCATCDAEHPYKAGKEPRRRRKDGTFEDSPTDLSGGQLVLPRAPTSEPNAVASGKTGQPTAPTPLVQDNPQGHGTSAPHENGAADHWPANRQLIRASLPRTEGDVPPPRPIPEFTMHQRPFSRRDSFRQATGWSGHGGGNANGNGPASGHGRPGRPHGRPGQGEPNGNGGSQPNRHRGGKSGRAR
jgi:hypothetical protein